MSDDDEGVEPGTPEFEAAAMEGLMSNLSLPWADRVACGQKAINILRRLLTAERDATNHLLDVRAVADPRSWSLPAEPGPEVTARTRGGRPRLPPHPRRPLVRELEQVRNERDALAEKIALAIEAYEPDAHPAVCPPTIAYHAAQETAAWIARSFKTGEQS